MAAIDAPRVRDSSGTISVVRSWPVAVIVVVLALHCAGMSPYRPCGADGDCGAGETCAHDRMGSFCLRVCEAAVDAGHDPRCPPGFMCWAEAPHLTGNVCREGEDPSWREHMLDRYLRRLDGGLCCGGSYFLIVDGGEIVGHRLLFLRDD